MPKGRRLGERGKPPRSGHWQCGNQEFCIRSGYADRWWFCRPSVRMFNLLLSDCGCPRMLSFLPDRVTGLLKIRISEHPYSYCDQLGPLLGFPENRSPTFWTKVECHGSTAICSTRISFGDALSEPDLLSRRECLNTESASRPALAFEAVAHGDADGVPEFCREVQPPASLKGLDIPSRRAVFVPWKPSRRPAFG